MKISSGLTKAINEQIAMEANASNNYLAMACWCEINGYDESAEAFFTQSNEERTHMMKFVTFLSGQGVKPVIPSTKQPSQSFKSFESICKIALKNEQAVTKSIQKIAEMALKQKDFATRNFIQWFVDEQIEEEQKFETILQKFDLLGRDKLAIYEINKLLGLSTSSTEE